MYGIINCLYTPENQRAFEKLYADSNSKEQMLLRSTIAEAFKDCPKILQQNGSDWILCTLASYHKSEDDTMRVFAAIMRNLEHFHFGLLTDDIKWKEMNDIADSCLVGLSFFRGYIETKHKRQALPSPDYYTKAGAVAFQRLGFEDVGKNFVGWSNFIKKEMTID
jgi:hypothetical protein